MFESQYSRVLKAYRREFAVLFGVIALVIAAIHLSYPVADRMMPYAALSVEESFELGWLVGVLVATAGMLIAFRTYTWFIKAVGVDYSGE